MPDPAARIRVKLGQIEVEYEGEASFLKKDLIATVKELLELQKKNPAAAIAPQVAPQVAPAGGSAPPTPGQYNLSTDTIATVLDAKSGSELAIAAAAHLTFVKGQAKFTRQEIIDEMRKAMSHYKKSYLGNLTTYLTSLKNKDRLRLVGDDAYALSNKEKQTLEPALAKA